MQTPLRNNSALIKRLLGSIAILFAVSLVSLPSHATPLTFDFTFDDGQRTVAGQILGLLDQPGVQSATSVVVTTNPFLDLSGFNFVDSEFITNSFAVEEGNVVLVNFISTLNSTVNVLDPFRGSLTLRLGRNFSMSEPFLAINNAGTREVLLSTAVRADVTPSAQIPEPTSIALLAAGLGAIGVVRIRRKKNKLIE